MTGEDFPGWPSIPAVLTDRASRDGNLPAVIDGAVRLTYSQLADQARAFASGLMALGVRPGDRVPLWAPNSVRWVVAAYGIWTAGAAVVPISTRLKGLETGDLLERMNARVAVVEQRFLGIDYVALLDKHYGRGSGRPFDALPELEHVVLLDDAPRPGTADAGSSGSADAGNDSGNAMRHGHVAGRAGCHPIADVLAAGQAVPDDDVTARIGGIGPGDVAEILFTSGTTGAPKGVVLGHGQLLRNYWDWSGIAGIHEGDRFPGMAPFSHGFGINGSVLGCVIRAAVNLPVATFDADVMLRIIEAERVTVLAGVPALFHGMLTSGELPRTDTSSLHTAIVGAAAVPTELIHRMRRDLGIERVINAYGLIEGCVVSMTRHDDPDDVVAVTSGRALPGVEVRLTGPTGADVAAGEPGEILVRGLGVMRGYLDAPELSAQTVDSDGWLHTGDVGELDAARNLRIVDRLKDVIIVGGFNVYPAEVEGLLSRHPEVGQVAAIGRPDQRLGEAVQVYLVPASGVRLDGLPDRLLAWAAENMASYKRPTAITVLDELPVNPSGKVDKISLRDRAATGGDR